MRTLLLCLVIFFQTSLCQDSSASSDVLKRSLSYADEAPLERPVCKTYRKDTPENEEKIVDLTTQVSCWDMIDVIASEDTLESYMHKVYNQEEYISISRMKYYGLEKIKKTLFKQMYDSHEHAYFILTIFSEGLQNYMWSNHTENTFLREHRKFFIQLNQKANKGNAHAAFNLAYAYFHGICLEQDIPAAIMFLEKAASLNHSVALPCLLNIYRYGVPVITIVDGSIHEENYGVDDLKYKKWFEFAYGESMQCLPLPPIE